LRRAILWPTTLPAMGSGGNAEELAAQAAEMVRRLVSQADERAAEIIREAESEAAKIREQAEAQASRVRERAEADARAQIEAAKRALDELGGTLAAAASAAAPRSEERPSEPEPEPELEPEETPGAPETPVSPPAPEPEAPEPEQAVARTENGDDAAERLVAMKLAVDGKDPAAIEAELIEKFGPGDRTALLNEVLSRLPR
jgi:vacuolar-type H+-ATPase subunit H